MEKSYKVLFVGYCLMLVLVSFFMSRVVLAESLPERSLSSERKATSEELTFVDGFEPTPGTYYYDVFLKGAKLGRATISVDRVGEEYVVAVTARTRGMMKYLYKVKYRGEVAISRNPLQPSTARIEERTGRKKKTIHAEFEAPDRVVATEKESKENGPVKIKTKEYDSESFILDPFSTVFLIRSLDWEVGTSEVFDVFTGTKQYEIHLLCQDEDVVVVNGVSRPTWVIVPETRTLTEPKKVKMSGFSIYLSQDEKKEILKITGDPKIGRIVANLRKFKEREE